MAQAIGFANKFYTLWSIDTESVYTTDSHGNHWLTGYNTKFHYHKNISIDLEKAKSLHPDLDVMEDLRGKTSSWTSDNKEDLCPQIMKFGKYWGHNLDELVISDFQYVIWICENRGGTKNGLYASELPAVVAHYKAIDDATHKKLNAIRNIFNSIVSAGSYEFVAERNLRINDSFATMQVNVSEEFNTYVTFVFPNGSFTENYYNGFTYGLPLVKGKAKRIKGKTIELSFIKEESDEEWEVRLIVTSITIK
jgi:hypothetical protein